MQACFLGDVRVIWCNFLVDSLFQTYVMNSVSHAITSCTHYTSYSLLNLVHDIMCESVLAIQDYIFLDFNAKCVNVCVFEDNLIEKLVFGIFELN